MATTKPKPFRTILDPNPEIFSNPGTFEEEIWAMRLTETGEQEFYVKGKTNVYEKIQMFKDDCDLEQIIKRVMQTGDIGLMQKTQPFYAEFDDMPENIFEAHQKIKEAEEQFDKLPIEVKEKYGMSFDRFLADFGSENWLKNMGMIKEEVKEETKIETKGEETTE